MGRHYGKAPSVHRRNRRLTQLRRFRENVQEDALQDDTAGGQTDEILDNPQSSIEIVERDSEPLASGSGLNKPVFSVEGRRLVDIDYFFKQMSEISKHHPFDCTIKDMDIVQENRMGLKSQFVLKCRMCCSEHKINTIDDSKDIASNVNSALALATVSTGVGYSTADEIFSVLNVPFMAPATYQQHCEDISSSIEEVAWKIMEEAAKEEETLARNSGQIDEDGFPLITVIADGAWSKRSYSVNYDALSGVACIIGARTGRILFLGIRNKYCSVCARAEAKKISPAPSHKCYKNWQSTSTSMESDIICEGFRLSVSTHGMKYYQLVGDGDSSVYKKLIETRPYGNLLVHKIECRNHLLRNFSSKIREICARKRSNSKNCAVPPNLRKIVENNSGRLRTSIKGALTHRINEDSPMIKKVDNLRNDLRNVASHVFGEHKNCQNLAYFKCTPKEHEKNHVPSMKDCGLYEDIEICMNRLIYNASSLITNMDTNVAEHYNSVVCKFVGGKRVNFSSRGSYEARCKAAAISFNSGGDYYNVLGKALTQRSPPSITKRFVSKMKRRRESKRKCLKKNKFRRFKKQSLPDADYGPQAIPEPDLDPQIFEEKKARFLESLKKSEEEIINIEVLTRGQGTNQLWKQERLPRLTASNFGEICKLRKSTSCENIIKKLLYSPFFGNESTRYGTEHETIAIKAFEEKFGLKVEPCGLFIDKEEFIFGASPDGLIVGEDAILEVKCPKICSKMHPLDAIRDKSLKFADLVEDNQLSLKKNHNYFYQVQGQLHITKKSFCYFVIWSPCGMLVEMIAKDDKFWEEKMGWKLRNFYFQCLLPELIDARFTRNMKLRNPSRNY